MKQAPVRFVVPEWHSKTMVSAQMFVETKKNKTEKDFDSFKTQKEFSLKYFA